GRFENVVVDREVDSEVTGVGPQSLGRLKRRHAGVTRHAPASSPFFHKRLRQPMRYFDSARKVSFARYVCGGADPTTVLRKTHRLDVSAAGCPAGGGLADHSADTSADK